MHYNEHYNLEGKHAFLGASKNSWLNYSNDKLQTVYLNNLKKEKGTILHAFASSAIINRVKLANLKKALNLFVNDAIGYGMDSEIVLYYSDNCFGTADAILFKDGVLRIHDLKTGVTPVVHFNQLDIYCALFCLEYGVNPTKIDFIERLYQGNSYIENEPDKKEIKIIMEKIVDFDSILNKVKSELER